MIFRQLRGLLAAARHLAEAWKRWLDNATAATRIQLLKLITEGEPKTVRFAAERLLEKFALPQKRVACPPESTASEAESAFGSLQVGLRRSLWADSELTA